MCQLCQHVGTAGVSNLRVDGLAVQSTTAAINQDGDCRSGGPQIAGLTARFGARAPMQMTHWLPRRKLPSSGSRLEKELTRLKWA
jgi:hypothetical protein